MSAFTGFPFPVSYVTTVSCEMLQMIDLDRKIFARTSD